MVAAVLRAEAAVLQKEEVVAEEVLLMMQEILVILVEREDVEAVANLVAEGFDLLFIYKHLI